MDSGKLYIEKINFGIYLLILLVALTNLKFWFYNPYTAKVAWVQIAVLYYLFISHLYSLIMVLVGFVLTLKRLIEKVSAKNSFALMVLGLIHTLLLYATMWIIAAFVAVT